MFFTQFAVLHVTKFICVRHLYSVVTYLYDPQLCYKSFEV